MYLFIVFALFGFYLFMSNKYHFRFACFGYFILWMCIHLCLCRVCCSVAVCCGVLRCVVRCCSEMQCVVVCAAVLQWDAVCCSVCCSVAVRYNMPHCVLLCCSEIRCVAVCVAACSDKHSMASWVLQCVAVCVSVLQCVTVLQWDAVCCIAGAWVRREQLRRSQDPPAHPRGGPIRTYNSCPLLPPSSARSPNAHVMPPGKQNLEAAPHWQGRYTWVKTTNMLALWVRYLRLVSNQSKTGKWEAWHRRAIRPSFSTVCWVYSDRQPDTTSNIWKNTTHAKLGPGSHGDRRTWQMWRGAQESKVWWHRYTKVTWTVMATRWLKTPSLKPLAWWSSSTRHPDTKRSSRRLRASSQEWLYIETERAAQKGRGREHVHE